jgi:hypothetical protein
MFNQEPPDETSGLEKAIDEVYSEMARHSSDDDEYAKMVDQLSKLYSLRETPQRVSPDTLAIVIGNLIGIILIVGHERLHVVTSKALNFVMKLR